MYIALGDDEHRFVQKVNPACANGHWEHGCNSNPVATLPHATVVLYATIYFFTEVKIQFCMEFHYIFQKKFMKTLALKISKYKV